MARFWNVLGLLWHLGVQHEIEGNAAIFNVSPGVGCKTHPDAIYHGDEIDCKSRNLTKIPFLKETNVTAYLLDDNNFSIIYNSTFIGIPNTRHISLRNCDIETIEVGSFNSLIFLDVLILSENMKIHLTSSIFYSIRNLRTLEMDECATLKTFKNNVFSALSNIRNIYLRGSGLMEYQFNISKSLKSLNMDQNKFNQIPEKIIEDLSQLDDLILTNNKIPSLKLGSELTPRPEFRLSLSGNEITRINIDDLIGYRYVDKCYFILTANNVTYIDAFSFRFIKHIKIINISYNKHAGVKSLTALFVALVNVTVEGILANNIGLEVPQLPNDIFAPLSDTSLKYLQLGSNKITSILDDDFKNLSTLESLDLSDCGITSVSSKAFTYLIHLRHLDLRENNFSPCIVGVLLSNLPKSMIELFIQGNNRKTGVINITSLSSLETVDISVNRVISSNQLNINLSGMRNLSNLKMNTVVNQEAILNFNISGIKLASPNILKYFEFKFNSAQIRKTDIKWFQSFLNLVILDLSHNDFSKCDDSTLVNFFAKMTSLRSLILGNCQLRTLPVKMFETMTKLVLVYMNNNNIHVIEAHEFSHPIALRGLSLKYNNLALVEDGAFKDWLDLNFLYVADNAFSCTCNLRYFRDWLNTTHARILGKNERCKSSVSRQGRTISDFQTSWMECDGHESIVIVTSCLVALLFFGIAIAVIFRYYIDLKLWYLIKQARRKGYIKLDGNDSVFDGFISYNSQDINWVKNHLIPNIEECPGLNFRLCIADRDFVPGNLITANIFESMQASNSLIFLVSLAFLASEWCQFELEHAEIQMIENRESSIILVFLEKIPRNKLPKRMSRLMRHVTYLEWDITPRKQELLWQKLKIALIGRKTMEREGDE